MVNYGASRGCKTCKQRRKKCDETRPICNRCRNTKRKCDGYEEQDPFFLFRNYAAEASYITPPSDDQSLTPEEIPDSTISVFSCPPDVEDTVIETQALKIFLRDFCLHTSDNSISRGFLDGLESLIARPSSNKRAANDVRESASIVAIAAIGRRLDRLSLVQSTVQRYGKLLSSFRETLASRDTAASEEILATAVLLGIYEIIVGGDHIAHVRGVGSILSSEAPTLLFRAPMRPAQIGNAFIVCPKEKLKIPSLAALSVPSVHAPVQGLDSILVNFNPTFTKSREILPNAATSQDDLRKLQAEARVIKAKFDVWASSQTGEWVPRMMHKYDLPPSYPHFSSCHGDWTRYFDLYVAATWNTCRKSHIMVLDILAQCKRRLQGYDSSIDLLEEEQEIDDLAKDIFASIPYHLDPKPPDLDSATIPEHDSSPTVAAGLLLLHPLCVIATRESASDAAKTMAKDVLEWTGKNLGIGQATLLADPECSIPFYFIAEGHVLLWSGMLI